MTPTRSTRRPRTIAGLAGAVLVLMFLIPPFATAAQDNPGELSIRATLPLDAPQRARLRELIASDAEARALFAQLRHEAEAYFDLQPQPLRMMHYEGRLNTDPRRIETVARLRELDAAAALLHYWQASDDPRAMAALVRMIRAWAATYVPDGNDVHENKLYPLFVAYEALRPSLDSPEQPRVDAWLERMGEFHIRHVSEKRQLSNRFTKSLRLVAIFGRILDRTEWRDASMAGLKRFVTESLRPDGTSFDLEHRDSLTYHNSALRPAIELAVLAGPDGPALYTWVSDRGGSLKASVDFVRPFATGDKTREEWVNSRVQLDHRRAAAGIEAYRRGRLFDPQDARALLEEASYFDQTLVPLVLKLHAGGKRFASWTMVLNAASAEPAQPATPRVIR